MDDLIIVDCQNDFIDGTLACVHGREAAEKLVHFMNTHEVHACYSADWHRETNRSFKENGGMWPVHCVQGTHGAALSSAFERNLEKEENKPGEKNIFYKGTDDDVEEYSAFFGKNEEGCVLGKSVSPHVYAGGIALEYCVRETVLALLARGIRVTLLTDCVGYVNQAECAGVLEELQQKGAVLLDSAQV